MKRNWQIGIGTLLLALAGCPRKAMTEDRLKLELTPLRVENASKILSVRLAGAGAHTLLASLARGEDQVPIATLASLDGAAGTGTVLTKVELPSLFGIPSWDVEAGQTGTIAAVWTMPLSATCPLAFRGSDGNEMILTAGNHSGIYRSPRFLRADRGAGAGVTAILDEAAGRTAVVFTVRSGGHEVHERKMPMSGLEGPVEFLVAEAARGFLGFVKDRTLQAVRPDAAGRIPQRKDGRGEGFQPGTLRAIRLNAAMEPVGSLLQPIGDVPIFEFDAAISNSIAYIMATTATGYIAAVGRADGDVWHWTTAAVRHPDRELVSPAIAAGPAGVRAVAIEGAGTQSAKVLAGFFQVR